MALTWMPGPDLALGGGVDIRYGGGLWLAFSAAGEIKTSTDRATWTTRTSGFGTSTIKDAAYADGLWVIVGASGKLATSPDGATWTLRTSGFSTTWINGVAYGAGLWVIVGDSGKISTSPDGETWTSRNGQIGTLSLGKVAYGGGKWRAIGQQGQMAGSADGVTWSTVPTLSPGYTVAYTLAFGDGRWIVGGFGGYGQIHTSTDGDAWSLGNLGYAYPVPIQSAVRAKVGWFLAGGVEHYSSADGVSWSRQSYPIPNPPGSGYLATDESTLLSANDSGELYEAVIFLGNFVTETAALNDSTSDYLLARETVRERAVLLGYASDFLPAVSNVRETAQLGDRLGGADLFETAVLNDSATDLVIQAVRETAVLNDRTTQAVAQTVRETAVLNDATHDAVPTVVRETAVLDDRASGFARSTTVVRETAMLDDRASGFARTAETVRETAVLADAPSDRPPVQRVRETAVLNDATSVAVTARTDVRETAVLNDRAGTVVYGVVRETAVLNDRATDRLRARDTVRDTAVLFDVASDYLLARDTARETAILSDVASDHLIARDAVRERGFISGDAVPPKTDTAWTANIQTWAMSRYDGFPFESLTERYAAGADGLFVPGAETFTARIETGDLDFGKSQLKRVESIYALGTHADPLTIEVTADVRGARQTASYTQMARNADDTRIVRATLGKGFHSSTYRFAFASGADFTLESAEVVVAAGQRRI